MIFLGRVLDWLRGALWAKRWWVVVGALGLGISNLIWHWVTYGVALAILFGFFSLVVLYWDVSDRLKGGHGMPPKPF